MDFSKLLSQIDSVTSKKTYDENSGEYWKPTKDKAGNASAVIRFLPNKDVDDFPFVRMFSHSFKNVKTGRWYIENSLTTIGQQDYIAEVNTALWATGIEENKKLVSLQKRKLSYISNILVIKDIGNPENNGKVFKYKYGAKIFAKIVNAAKPDEALGEQPINPFDVILGANFILKMQKVDDQFNYDASKFGAQQALFDGDEDQIDATLKLCYDLSLEIAPDKFKTPEELKKQYLRAVGQLPNTPATPARQESGDLDEVKKAVNQPTKAPETVRKGPPLPTMDASDGDDDAAFFAGLMTD